MVATKSTMIDLSSLAPPFNLPDTNKDNQFCDSSSFHGQPMLVMFICNHCPYVIHIIEKLVEIGNQAQRDGMAVIALSANDAGSYPQDGPDRMTVFAKQHQFEFPYCYDESQAIAKAYQAACTPDFFVFDSTHRLQYRGQMDSARPGNSLAVNGSDLSAAIRAVLNGLSVSNQQIPSVGCNIKWQPGNQPEYF
jgi:peroxiredoxin